MTQEEFQRAVIEKLIGLDNIAIDIETGLDKFERILPEVKGIKQAKAC